MVITFHALMLRSEKNNAAQNALGFTKKNTTKMHSKINWFHKQAGLKIIFEY